MKARPPARRAPRPTVAALTIAGSDSGGGAGAQADLRAFAAAGVYGVCALTALTAQNPDGISAVHPAPAAFVRAQLEQVAAYYPVRAVKTGMLFQAAVIMTVADFLSKHPQWPVVVDPVMTATSGRKLLALAAWRALVERLLPRAALVTPNLDEAATLLGRPVTPTPAGLDAAAAALADKFGVPVLLKGGHARLDPVRDIFARPGGPRVELRAARVRGVNKHGGGCALAASIAAHLARGAPPADAVARAHAALQRAFAMPLTLNGKKFLNHAAMADDFSPPQR